MELVFLVFVFFAGSVVGCQIGYAIGYNKGLDSKKIIEELNEPTWKMKGDWK